jgi:hypothetical protein
MTREENVHGHDGAEVEPNHDEGGHEVYECILIHDELHSENRESIIDKRTREVEGNSTNMMSEIVNTLQNCTIITVERSRRRSMLLLTN